MKNKNLFSDNWKDYFYLHKSLRKGFAILFLILSVQIIVLLYLQLSPVKNGLENASKYNAEIEKFLTKAEDKPVAGNYTRAKIISENNFTRGKLFPFNPNNLPEADWKELGFSDRQIRVIKNYEGKGGRFYSKDDVRKMYCISESEFNRIEPYILIPAKIVQSQNFDKKTSVSKESGKSLIVDINSADTTELIKLNGIGPVKARIIYHYREKLGGFYSVHQLQEAWGINDSLFESLLPHITLTDSVNLKKIKLNIADVTELGKHPYIGFNLARVIVNYRKEHGAFYVLNDLRKVPLITESIYFKIAHYLTVDSD